MVARVMQDELQKKIRLDVFKAFEDLLLIDVSVFVLVCAMMLVLQIAITWCKYRWGYDVASNIGFIQSLQDYLVGANWCVSCIAIYNLFTIEHKFSKLKSMKSFDPNLKFWSIKIMVLVSFWAALVMEVIKDVMSFSALEGKLLDASFRIYVMACVSILNLYAWWPCSSWYSVVLDTDRKAHFDDRYNYGVGHKIEGDIGVPEVPPGTEDMVRKLFPEKFDDKAPQGDFMKGNPRDSYEVKTHVLTEASPDQIFKALYSGSQLGWVIEMEAKDGKKGRQNLRDMEDKARRECLAAFLESFYLEK
jgi:hypothetical protein